MPGRIEFQIAAVSINHVFGVEADQASSIHGSALFERNRITPKFAGLLQKPLLTAKYGMSATSARPGRGSVLLNTASVLQFTNERK